MLNPFNLFRKVVTWFNEGISLKARIIIVAGVFLFFVGMGIVGYEINDYFENNPQACLTCHVHDAANQKWAVSIHKSVNCHQCHHSTKKDQIIQIYRFVFLGVHKVSPRHGNVLVAWQVCYSCHWERNSKYPNAKDVSGSRLHARHVFMEKIQCVKCHGYKIHEFTAEPRFCVRCHKGREVHGTGMEGLACLNCHTDRTPDLKPGRNKCLFCHGGEDIRKQLIADGTIDVRHYQPSENTIKRAIKIKLTKDAPMQFNCYTCHKPHINARADWGNCETCHSNILDVGKHKLHIQDMNLKCKQCHIPHIWRVTPEQAKKACTKCHEYRDPMKFLS
jgi:nitrate reductase cytochrome c-type subunit